MVQFNAMDDVTRTTAIGGPRAWNKKIATWGAFFLTVVVCAGQQAGNQTVTGFRVPDYDREGHLRQQLFGDKAEILPEGEIRITNLRIEVYQGTDVSMLVSSPWCMYRELHKRVDSDAPVQITRQDMTLTGTGFEWNGTTERLRIRNDVRLVLVNSRERMRTGVKP